LASAGVQPAKDFEVSVLPINRLIASGVVAAVAATILGAVVLPDQPQTILGVFARAAVYVLLVFAAAAITTYLGFRLSGEGQTTHAGKVAIRTAAAMIWLPPLLMFSEQGSWFALVLWPVFIFEVARLIAFVRAMLHENREASAQTPDGPFSVLKHDFPHGTSILGALMIQGAIFSGVDGRTALAGLLYVAGTTAIAYRVLQMFLSLPFAGSRTFRRRILAGLTTTTLLIIFAWLPQIVGSGGSGVGRNSEGGVASGRRSALVQSRNGAGARKDKSLGQETASALARLKSLFVFGSVETRSDSFAVARHILDSTFPHEPEGASSSVKSLHHTEIASSVFVAGSVFAGVQLYPEVEPHTRLVAPPPSGAIGFGSGRSDPMSIPFDGVYWFWRGPSDQPPSNSVVMHGSPSARFLRSTEGDGMSMEARQNLGFEVDPKRYGAIELYLTNADPFPNSVSILLRIRNTTLPGKPTITLGMEEVATPASSIANGNAVAQVLRFSIPSAIRIQSFDELTVSYYLKGARGDRSARIAIDRFRLVPRGG
jgi:hypothetical protein